MNWKLLNNLSHHAHLLVGDRGVRDDLLVFIEKNHRIPIRGNPDFFDVMHEAFTIEDARNLKSSAEMRPVSPEGKKIFIITANAITTEAQNALLKLLEEPPEYAHFFLIVPSAHLLLPTVRSRMKQITDQKKASRSVTRKGAEENASDNQLLKSVEKFVTLSPAKRLEEVKKLVEDISKEKKTRQDAIDFLDALQRTIRGDDDIRRVDLRALETIETARTYLTDRAPSVKMLLEYIALNI